MSAGRLQVHNVIASHVFASLEMDHGKLKISDLRAEALGGKWRGDWHADFTDNPPMYAGSGALSGISLEEVAGAMHDPWISGTAAGTYQFTAVGADATAFWQSVEGELQFDLQDGTFSHILLPSDERPLHVARWQGSARVRTGKIELEKEKLFASEGTYEVGGTASFGRALNLTLTRSSDTKAGSSQSYSITGTVEEPQVTLTPTPDTQAQLKP
jgi:AsmA protein